MYSRSAHSTCYAINLCYAINFSTLVFICATHHLIYSDNQAIQAVKAAIAKPNNSNFRLLECEFPALASLNKLGDGSLQSSNAVDDSNLATAVKLCNALSVPVFGPTACLLTSASATGRLLQRARKAYRTVHSLRDGVPDTSKNNNLFVLVAPSGRDYAVAQQLAADGATVVLVNGFAKVRVCV